MNPPPIRIQRAFSDRRGRGGLIRKRAGLGVAPNAKGHRVRVQRKQIFQVLADVKQRLKAHLLLPEQTD